jgi:phosphoribosylformylglycinamidine synthase
MLVAVEDKPGAITFLPEFKNNKRPFVCIRGNSGSVQISLRHFPRKNSFFEKFAIHRFCPQSCYPRSMKFGVITFPGSNCDHDSFHVIAEVAQQPVTFLWHDSSDLQGVDAIIVPGGFSYGDYLRTGAIARFSPVMQSVKKFAADGGLVMGICNGFQILTESGLLPGALMRNAGLHFISKQIFMRTETVNSPFTSALTRGEVLQVPIAHMEGNYFCEPEVLRQLEAEDRIAFRYSTADGQVTPEANPNGAVSNIAGILNEKRNVLGLMPHPERASEEILGSADGWKLFASMLDVLATR